MSKRKRKKDLFGYPAGFKAVPDDERIQHPPIFDPALKHFPHAFRKGEPAFSQTWQAAAWKRARLNLIHHLLKTFAGSSLRDCLVVRGSVLLNQWLGKQARDPKDIDWVVSPPGIQVRQPVAKDLLRRTIQLVTDHSEIDGLQLNCGQLVMDDIWTYDRAPGKRLVIPWQAEDLPPGFLQMDFVFEEELWCPTVDVVFPGFSDGLTIQAASPEQSLAWKILWLSSDMYPMGKDLYDAVLLAENFPVSRELLEIAYSDNGRQPDSASRDAPLDWEVTEWLEFQSENPGVRGSARDWLVRLRDALAPAFDNR